MGDAIDNRNADQSTNYHFGSVSGQGANLSNLFGAKNFNLGAGSTSNNISTNSYTNDFATQIEKTFKGDNSGGASAGGLGLDIAASVGVGVGSGASGSGGSVEKQGGLTQGTSPSPTSSSKSLYLIGGGLLLGSVALALALKKRK